MKERMEKLPLVVIAGRTNVGKSALFNCLLEKNQALVSETAGTTRDSNLGAISWRNQAFTLVDTAGLLGESYLNKPKIIGADLDSQTQRQARSYLERADLILFLVDTKSGLIKTDRDLATALKRRASYRAKIILVANKTDSLKLAGETAEFNRLGLGEPALVSAANGLGTGDLLDLMMKRLKKLGRDTKDEGQTPADEGESINVCIIGKPNVGKSSLLNAILGYERVLVSPMPHTTREPQNTTIVYQGQRLNLIDTAGISRQGKKSRGLEKPGILKSLKSLDKADIALLVLDISEGLTHQDAKLVEEVADRRKSLILIANKWDLVKDRQTKKWTDNLYDKLPFATWAPLQFISARTGEKVNKILDLVLAIAEQRRLTLSASQTAKFLSYAVKIHKPAKGKGLKAPRIYEFRQLQSNPPLFILRIGPHDDLHFSYLRFWENRLREKYGFLGTPLTIRVTKDKKSPRTYNKGEF